MRRLPGLFALLALVAVPLAARKGGPGGPGGGGIPDCPSHIVITQYPTGTYNQRTANVTVVYEDDEGGDLCFSTFRSFDLNTFRFYVNGVDRTSYFTVGAHQATASALPVGNDDAVNQWSVQILGWAFDGSPVTNYDTKYVTVDWTPAVSISTAPHEYQVLDAGQCALECFQVTARYQTPAYLVMDQPQAVTLAYHSDWARPRPIVQMDVIPPTGMSGDAQMFRFEVKVNGAYRTFINGETSLQFWYAAQTVRLKGQFDASDLSTGVYPMDVEVGIYYGAPDSKWVWSSISTRLTVINEIGSRFGRGWSMEGLAHLYEQSDGSALVVDGSGVSIYFNRSCPTCSFTTPNGATGRLTVSGTAPNRTFRWVSPDSVATLFNDSGYQTSVADRFGNTWSYLYTGSDLTTIRDPLYGAGGSHVITLSYGTYGLSSIVSQGSRTTTANVNSSQVLWRIKEANGDSTRFGYAGSGQDYRMTSMRDNRGNLTTFGFTASSHLASVTAPAVPVYGVGTVQPQVTFSPWQDVGLPTGGTSPPVTAATPASITGSVTDAEGRTTTFSVDKWGQPLSITDPLGAVTSILRDGASGLPIRVLYPWGGKDSATYNADGLVTMRQSTGRGTVRLRYGNWGQVDSVWGDTPPVRIGLGANGRADWVRYAGDVANTVAFGYNSRGQTISMQDPSGAVRRWSLEASLGNTSKDSLPGRRLTTYSRDAFGRVITVARTGAATQTLYYDGVNRVDSVADGVNPGRIRFAYDGDLLQRVQDQEGQVYRYAYNALGWLTHRYDPADTLGRYDHYEYDRSGLVRRWTNRRGQAITLGYDALGRLTSKSGTNTPTESWGYSSDFRQMVAVGEITRDSVYLSTGLLVDSTVTRFCEPSCSQRFRVASGYDTRGQLTSVTPMAPAGISLAARTYNRNLNNGTLQSMTVGGLTTSFGYDARLLGTTTTYPGPGNTVTRTFTSVADRSQILAPSSYAGAVNRDIELDTLSRVRAQYRQDNTGVKYTYDALGRLTVARFQYRLNNCTSDPDYGRECPDGILDHEDVFTYDAVGNRTDLGGSYATGNRVQYFDGWTVRQDLDGNDTSKVGSDQDYRYRWTAEGRLDSVRANGTWYHLRYGADGRLVGWDVDGARASRLLWDRGSVLAELNTVVMPKTGAYALVNRGEYSSYPGTLDAPYAFIDSSGTQHVLHRDAVGNVIATTDQALTVQQQVTYGTWGDELSVSEPSGYHQRMRWKGALSLQPEIGLVYLRARWYDPDLGRFESEDPIGLVGGINTYGFGGADPVNMSDPTGRCFGPLIFLAPLCWAAAEAAVEGITHSIVIGILTSMLKGDEYTWRDVGIDVILGAVGGLFAGTVDGVQLLSVNGRAFADFGAVGLSVLHWTRTTVTVIIDGAGVGASLSGRGTANAGTSSRGTSRSRSQGRGHGHNAGGGGYTDGDYGNSGPGLGGSHMSGTWHNPECNPILRIYQDGHATLEFPCAGLTYTLTKDEVQYIHTL